MDEEPSIRILLLTTSDTNRAVEKIITTIEAFGDTNTFVTIKNHPIIPEAPLKRRVKLPKNFIWGDQYKPPEHFFKDTDLVIYDGSTMGLEALNWPIPIPIVFLRSDLVQDLDPLGYMGLRQPYVRGAKALRRMVYLIFKYGWDYTMEDIDEDGSLCPDRFFTWESHEDRCLDDVPIWNPSWIEKVFYRLYARVMYGLPIN